MRLAVATNPAAPVALLAALASDADWIVRERVARHPNTPPAALAVLAGDKVRLARLAVAQHANTPPDVLEALAGDADMTTANVAGWRLVRQLEAAGLQIAIVPSTIETARKYRAARARARRVIPAMVVGPRGRIRSLAVGRSERTVDFYFGRHTVAVTLPRGYRWEIANERLRAVAPSGATFAPDAETLLSARAAESILSRLAAKA